MVRSRGGLAAAGLVMSLFAGLGCGARAMLEPEEEGEPLASAGAGGSPTSGPSGGRGGFGALTVAPPPAEAADPPCSAPLPQARTPQRNCPFVERDESLCYQTEACACAGACRPGEQCIIGGFLSPDEPQLVSCVDLR